MDAIGGPGARVDDSVVGQRDRMEYPRLNTVLPALGQMNPRWLRCGKRRELRKRVLESCRLKDTIRYLYSEGYSTDAKPKDSVDQDTPRLSLPRGI